MRKHPFAFGFLTGSLTTLAIVAIFWPLLVHPALKTGMYLVTHVADGDTVTVQSADGTRDTVRLLGLDTPEIKHQSKPAECYGVEATEKTKELVLQKYVTLTKKPSEDRDNYGRLLRYVFVDGKDIGSVLMQEGFARNFCKQYPHPKCGEYDVLEKEAQKNMRGMWGACR